MRSLSDFRRQLRRNCCSSSVFHAGAFAGAAGTVVGAVALKFRANQKRNAQKRGGEFHITSLNGMNDVARIGEALDELAAPENVLAEIVDLKFFCGFTFPEIAVLKNIFERTAQRQWEKAASIHIANFSPI